ncbi:MAG: cytochrome C [Burkholderiaceae bacterium]|nr:cytochrome C [Sulfuritalea sp.]MCF8175554.1 cytochrome C [Burkholderiaceae bacterium]
MKRLIAGIALLTFSLLVSAQEVTYRKHIRPLWEDKCERCHGSVAPYLGTFAEDKKAYEADDKGPRMDSYADLIFFIGWPDTGAIMRRLDDGKHTKDGKAGNMYQRLGKTEDERQANLKLFKLWVGEASWIMKKPGEITKEELMRIKTPY